MRTNEPDNPGNNMLLMATIPQIIMYKKFSFSDAGFKKAKVTAMATPIVETIIVEAFHLEMVLPTNIT